MEVLTVVELQDARDELAASSQDVGAALRRIEDAVERLDGLTSVSPGLPVAETARYRGVSEPTVREWLKRGVLGAVPGAKPLLVERDALRRVHRTVEELRERGQDADCSTHCSNTSMTSLSGGAPRFSRAWPRWAQDTSNRLDGVYGPARTGGAAR